MNHWFILLNLAGSAVLAVFGLYVWQVEPGNRRNQAFVLYALGFSLGTALTSVLQILPPLGTPVETTGDALRGVLYGLGGLGAIGFGIATVEPDRRTILKWLAVPGVLAVAGVAAAMEGFISSIPFAVAALLNLGFIASLLGGSMFTALLLAEDFRRPDRGVERRRQRAFLAAALVLYPGFYLTFIGHTAAVASLDPSPGFQPGIAILGAAMFGTSLVVLLEWVRNTLVPEASGAARNVALLAAGMGVVGLVLGVTDAAGPGNAGVPFVARTGAVLILGYGVLRHQVLGIDEKVQFGVSRTTVAGVFVAVFFVVSEGAQVLLAGYANSEILGVLAAGALVFAISPLQRMADNFAAKAVPGGARSTDGGAAETAEETYRIALRAALRDRELTQEEERELAELAQRLGIGAGDAMRLREEVEQELRGDAP